MAIIPWKTKQCEGSESESSPLVELRHEMERLFDRYLRDPWETAGDLWSGQLGGPAVDVSVSDDEVCVRADVPGVEPNELELSVVGNTLVISGQRVTVSEGTEGGVVRRERRSGSFRRTVELPAPVDADRVTAEYQQGVLTVRLKKSAEATTRHIPIRAAAPPAEASAAPATE